VPISSTRAGEFDLLIRVMAIGVTTPEGRAQYFFAGLTRLSDAPFIKGLKIRASGLRRDVGNAEPLL
jgi:hypothetical protein